MLERHPVTTFLAPAPAFRMFVQEPLRRRRFRTLRHCISGGEALNAEVIAAWREGTGHHIHQGSGQTQTLLLSPPRPRRPRGGGAPGAGGRRGTRLRSSTTRARSARGTPRGTSPCACCPSVPSACSASTGGARR